MSRELAPCPFCGWQADQDLSDVVYPTGSYAHWIDAADHGLGLHFNGNPEGAAHAVWHVGCTENMGGCGASVYGLGREGAIAAWSRRTGVAGGAAIAAHEHPASQRFYAANAANVGGERAGTASAAALREAWITEALRLVDMYHRTSNSAFRVRLMEHLAQQPVGEPAMTQQDLADACGSYRGDFRLLDDVQKGALMFEAGQWARAFGFTTLAADDRPATAVPAPPAHECHFEPIPEGCGGTYLRCRCGVVKSPDE